MSKSYSDAMGQKCNLDLMDLSDRFGDDMFILGKDFFENYETWFSWDKNSVGFIPREVGHERTPIKSLEDIQEQLQNRRPEFQNTNYLNF